MIKCFSVKPKNDCQAEAIRYLMDPSIDLVIMEGQAGTGKTLLALAAGLEQTMESRMYSRIIWTRAPVAIGHDMGHLPGDINEKLLPWLGALSDNLEYLKVDPKDAERYIQPVALMHLRGRSFTNKYLVVDEVSNLTKDELKVIITRAGEGTKVVLMGCRNQVDNKKLNKDNNGLIDIINHANLHKTDYIRYIKLPDGVRSRLCNWGNLL